MSRVTRYLIPGAAFFVALAALVFSALAFNAQAKETHLGAAVTLPGTVNYQGFLTDDQGDPVDGTVKLQFDLFKDPAGGISLWSETHNSIPVDLGYFAVQLGSINPLNAADFTLPAGATTLYVQVSILPDGGGAIALPRQPLASVPYAFLAEEAAGAPWSGISGLPPGFADNIDDVEFQNVVTVAKSGAQFTSVQAAINSINDASGTNRYMVWVGPGIYDEQVILKPYIYLVGAGRWLTRIESGVANENIYPPQEATIHLAEYTHVRDLTVSNFGDGYRNVALLGLDGSMNSSLENIAVVATGAGSINYGIFLDGPNTWTVLEHVSSNAYGAAVKNVGMEVANGADAFVQDGRYRASNGEQAMGITGYGPGTRLDLFGVDIAVADTADGAYGLYLLNESVANLHGGSYVARNGANETAGIWIENGAALEATGVVALGVDSPLNNNGLLMRSATVVLHNGSFTGINGAVTNGIFNEWGGHLEANGVTAKGENGGDWNTGLRNESNAGSMLNGGYFYAQGGADNRGIASLDEGSVVDVQFAEVQGEAGANPSFGLSNEYGGVALVTHSEVAGSGAAILADGANTTVHLSRLGGGVAGGGEVTCLAVTSGPTFYPDGCP